MKKVLITGLLLSLLCGCSNTYVGGEETGIVKSSKEIKRTYTTYITSNKVTIPQIITSRTCNYIVDAYGEEVGLSVSGRCSIDIGKEIKLEKIIDKDTHELVRYRVK